MLDPVLVTWFETLKQAKQINNSNYILQCFVVTYIVYSYNSLSNDY